MLAPVDVVGAYGHPEGAKVHELGPALDDRLLQGDGGVEVLLGQKKFGTIREIRIAASSVNQEFKRFLENKTLKLFGCMDVEIY